MASPVRALDRVLRRAYGIFEYGKDPDCLFRVSVSEANRRIELPGFTLEKGARLVELHFWNEHVPPLPDGGATLRWAKQLLRKVDRAFRDLAKELESDARLAGAQAIGGVMNVFEDEDEDGPSAVPVLMRLGFRVAAYRNPHGEFAELWSRLYAWALLGTFQRNSLRGHRLRQLHRAELWMPIPDFLSRYGDGYAGVSATSS